MGNHKTVEAAQEQLRAVIRALEESEPGCVKFTRGGITVAPADREPGLVVDISVGSVVGVGIEGTEFAVGVGSFRPALGSMSYDGGAVDCAEDPTVTAVKLLAQARKRVGRG